MNDATPITLAQAAMERHTFVPVSRNDLIEAILSPDLWTDESQRTLARRVFHKMGCLRQHQSAIALNDLSEAYDPFNPDDDTINQRELSVDERATRRRELVEKIRKYALSANYVEVSERGLQEILEKATPDGVDVEVDFSEFDVKLLFYRGEEEAHREKRDIRRLYIGKSRYAIVTFNRLFMALKFKPEELRILEIMDADKIDRAAAKKKLKKLRRLVPKGASMEHVYLKIFKDVPRYDVEMLFPNIRVKMKYTDKLQLGGSAVLGTITWVLGTATKLLVAVALSPVVLAVALLTGLGGIIYAQVRNIFITRDRYRMQVAQSLYFQNLANNQGALALIVDEAEEEDIKEEVLLYRHLLDAPIAAAAVEELDRRVEAFLQAKFKINVDFDIHDAIERLVTNGLVIRSPGGDLSAVPLDAADRHMRERWCGLIDEAA